MTNAERELAQSTAIRDKQAKGAAHGRPCRRRRHLLERVATTRTSCVGLDVGVVALIFNASIDAVILVLIIKFASGGTGWRGGLR